MISARLKAELEVRYAEPHRHYHTMVHVRALLDHAAACHDDLDDPGVVEAAIWFHDAVYDSRAKDNEARSAALAAEMLKGRMARERLRKVVAMIEATASHKLPELPGRAGLDAALFLDIDLSILGAPAEVFDACEHNVRLEYAWVPDDRWRRGRAAVLAGFLERPRLFLTERFHRLLDMPARENLRRSLAVLTP